MKTIFLLVGFSLSCYSLSAVSTGQLIGQVVDKHTGLPVPFAEIIFENKMDRVVIVANENGHYYADHLPTGRYQMRIFFNQRTFVVNKVQVYDNYTSEIDVPVSSDASLAESVELTVSPNPMSSASGTDIKLRNSNNHQPTQSLADALSSHAGVDVRNGKLFIKGSDQVKDFVDGTPVLGQPTIGRIW